MVFERFDCHVLMQDQFPIAPFYDMRIVFEVPLALQLILRSGFGTGNVHHRKTRKNFYLTDPLNLSLKNIQKLWYLDSCHPLLDISSS